MKLTQEQMEWLVHKDEICEYIQNMENHNEKMEAVILALADSYGELKSNVTKLFEDVLGKSVSLGKPVRIDEISLSNKAEEDFFINQVLLRINQNGQGTHD